MSWQDRKRELRESFLKDGYVMLKGFLSADEVKEVYVNLERFVRDVIPTLDREQVYYEDVNDPSTIKQVPKLAEHDDYFRRWHTQGRCRELAEALLGAPVVPQAMQFFNKPPGVGQPTPAHQDGYYFMLTPCEALTMWLALEEVDQENGCVRYVKGSNHRGMRPHGRTDTLGFSQGITDYGEDDKAGEIAFAAGPGDLLVHHAMTVHRADGNNSASRSRRALGLVYFAEHAREDSAAKAAYHQQLEREQRQAGKI